MGRRYPARTLGSPVTRRSSKLALICGLFGVVVALRYWLQAGGRFPGDRWSVRRVLFRPHHPEALARLAHVYAALAWPGIALAVVLLGALAAVARFGARAGLGVLFSAVVVVINIGLKHAWGPTRPLLAALPYNHMLNYPAGHVSYAVSVFGYLGVLARRARRDLLAMLCAIIALGMGPARIMSDAHLVSDCVGGFALGLGWLLLTVWCVWPGEVGRPTMTRNSGSTQPRAAPS